MFQSQGQGYKFRIVPKILGQLEPIKNMLIVQEVTTGPTTAQKHLLAATSLSGLGESTAFLVMVAAARMFFFGGSIYWDDKDE